MAANRADRRRQQKHGEAPLGIWKRLELSFRHFMAGKSPIFVFLLKFLAVIIPFYLLWNTLFFKDNLLAPWNNFNTILASFVLNIFGAETQAIGNSLLGPSASIRVFEGCDGIEPTMLLVAGIVAFPATLKHKLKGVLLGSLFILLLNFLRIVSLYVIQVHWPAGFEFMHIEFWQVVFIFISILVWVYWIRKSQDIIPAKDE